MIYLLSHSMQRNFLVVICGTLNIRNNAISTYSIIVLHEVGDVVGLKDVRDDVGVDGLVLLIASSFYIRELLSEERRCV